MVRSRKREGLGFCLSGFTVKSKRERERERDNTYEGFSFLVLLLLLFNR